MSIAGMRDESARLPVPTKPMLREPQSFVAGVTRLCVLSALGGCAVGPDFTKPKIAVPERWSAKDDPRLAAQTAADSVWWHSFQDPALDRLVELAYRQNLPLQIAGLKIVEARAQLGIATGKQFPQVQAIVGNVTATGLSGDAANTGILQRHYVDYEAGFDAVWELDFWGKYRRGVQAEAAGLLASVDDYYSAIVSLTAEVARTYALIRTFEVFIDLAEKNAGLQEEGLKIARSRFDNGATSELDVAQATTLLESTRSTIPGLKASLQQARNALSTLLAQPPGMLEGLLTGPKEIPTAPQIVGVGVPAQMLRRRPDIHSAEQEAAAQCARIGVAKAELYPTFALFGTIGFQASTGANVSFALGHSLFYSVGPRLYFPFFNYGRLENNVRVEDARFQQLLVSYHNVVLKAAQEVEDAMAGFINARDALVFADRAVTSAQRAVQLSLTEYREGAADYQRVLDAQRALLQQDNNLAQTRSTVITSLVALYKALGGGWESRQGQPVLTDRSREEMKERTNWGDLLSKPSAPETNEPPPHAEP
jgi:NodT family efflux transporter outer membrane factor (OMF) lipoprotein